jgi:membrane fusion protein, heavy metal efflux system
MLRRLSERSAMGLGWTTRTRHLVSAGAIAVIAIGSYVAGRYGALSGAAITPVSVAQSQPSPNPAPVSDAAPTEPALELTDKQLASIKVGPVGEHVFPLQKEAVGSIDFDENMSVQVFPSYQGKIITAFAQVGDEVEKGKPLFTIDSPDLVQAESTLIAAAGVFELTTRALARAQKLYATQGTGGIAQKDLDQATSDKQSAEGALKAARDAVRVFGKTEAEIDGIVAERRIDPQLVVKSPITGKVTARNAQPGLLVQPGNAPAPYTVSDISTMWMVANVPESDSSSIKLGQTVHVSVMANLDQVYDGKISTVGATVDPNLHTLLVRSDVKDPRHELRPGMFATFTIDTGNPVTSTAIPVNGVVREGDGTMTVWVTTNRHRFTQRSVKVGLQHDGFDQILEGVTEGELVVTDGAVFLDNMLTASPTD